MKAKLIYSLLMITVLFVLTACKSEGNKSDNVNSEVPSQVQETAGLSESIERGEIVFSNFCMQCHMADGKGVPGTFPPLAGSNWLIEKRKESIHAVKYGQSGEIEVNGETYNSVMVAMGLSDEEIADVLNYVMNSWGNSQDKMVTTSEVRAVIK
jgi:mono/diheme cytochrome c family protein